jgi:nucleotide-binding universal stress UspA family protein
MGETVDQIIALAGHVGCSRIVIGSRGLSVTKTLLLGSLAPASSCI